MAQTQPVSSSLDGAGSICGHNTPRSSSTASKGGIRTRTFPACRPIDNHNFSSSGTTSTAAKWAGQVGAKVRRDEHMRRRWLWHYVENAVDERSGLVFGHCDIVGKRGTPREFFGGQTHGRKYAVVAFTEQGVYPPAASLQHRNPSSYP
jgi:hypothetical protein